MHVCEAVQFLQSLTQLFEAGHIEGARRRVLEALKRARRDEADYEAAMEARMAEGLTAEEVA